MSGRRVNTAVNSCTCPTIPKRGPYAVVTFRGRRVSPGAKQWHRMGRLRVQTNSKPCTRGGPGSSHTWFVLTYLLGYPHVRNYDGSWTEWGNLVGVPIEKTA